MRDHSQRCKLIAFNTARPQDRQHSILYPESMRSSSTTTEGACAHLDWNGNLDNALWRAVHESDVFDHLRHGIPVHHPGLRSTPKKKVKLALWINTNGE